MRGLPSFLFIFFRFAAIFIVLWCEITIFRSIACSRGAQFCSHGAQTAFFCNFWLFHRIYFAWSEIFLHKIFGRFDRKHYLCTQEMFIRLNTYETTCFRLCSADGAVCLSGKESANSRYGIGCRQHLHRSVYQDALREGAGTLPGTHRHCRDEGYDDRR